MLVRGRALSRGGGTDEKAGVDAGGTKEKNGEDEEAADAARKEGRQRSSLRVRGVPGVGNRGVGCVCVSRSVVVREERLGRQKCETDCFEDSFMPCTRLPSRLLRFYERTNLVLVASRNG
jgi:hypothetical protein